METLKILILEDSYIDAEIIQQLLKKAKPECEFHLAMDKYAFLKELDEFVPDVILSDNSLPQFNALEALKVVRKRSKGLPFILVTGTVSDEFAANIMKQGADDYILKDNMLKLPIAIDAAIKQKNLEKDKQEAVNRLIQSEEKYRTIFSKSPLPKWIYDTETLRFLEVNEAAIRHYGYSLNEFLNITIKDIMPKEDMELLLLDIKKISFRSDAQQGIWRHLKKNGEIINVQTTAHSINYDSRKVRMVVAIDITEKIKAEETLSRNELRFRTLTSNAPVGIFQTDAAGKTIYVNETWMKYTGLTFEEAMGSGWINVLHPEDKEKQIEQWQDRSQSGIESFSEFRLLDKKRNTRWVIGKATPLFDKNYHVTGYIGTLSDITETKLAEEELKKSNERFKYAAQATSDIIWELNFETKQYLIHEGAEKLFGKERYLGWETDVEGKYIIKEDRERVKKSFREARLDPACELWTDEYRVWGLEKTILNIINHAIFIRDKKRKVIRAIGAITDITEKKKLETKLLEQQKREQIKITATALEAQEIERNAIGVELHDNVNQIIVGTKILLSTLKDISDNDKNLVASCMKNLQSAIDENRKIAHALVTPNLETDTLVDQINRLTYSMLETAGLKVRTDSSSYLETSLDKEKKIAIYRIAQEQCTNIIKYAKATEVSISISNTDKNFNMIITDNGIGMERGKKTKGIGLRNINSRLSIFNGNANITTAPGKGFSLEIEIPL